MASPNKIKNVGYDYKPFQMNAAGPKYKNSPIEKNYGSPAQRGFDFTGGVGSKEMESGVGTAFDYASPAKGWLSNIAKKVGGGIKKAVGMTPIGMGAKALFGNKGGGEAEAAAAQAQAAAAGGAVAPHGDEAHTSGGGGAQVADASGFGTGGPMGTMTAGGGGGGMAAIAQRAQAGTEEDPTKPVDPRKAAMGSWGGLSSMF